MQKSIFPEITKQMAKRNEKLKDLANLLQVDTSQISRKLTGYIDWSIREIKILCKHYNIKFEKLFRKENEIWNY